MVWQRYPSAKRFDEGPHQKHREPKSVRQDCCDLGDSSPYTMKFCKDIELCSKAGNIEGAEILASEMRKNGIVPGTGTFNHLIYACARTGAVDKAEAVMAEMLANRVSPTVVTFCNLI